MKQIESSFHRNEQHTRRWNPTNAILRRLNDIWRINPDTYWTINVGPYTRKVTWISKNLRSVFRIFYVSFFLRRTDSLFFLHFSYFLKLLCDAHWCQMHVFDFCFFHFFIDFTRWFIKCSRAHFIPRSEQRSFRFQFVFILYRIWSIALNVRYIFITRPSSPSTSNLQEQDSPRRVHEGGSHPSLRHHQIDSTSENLQG